jgi:hypothetical protein
LASWKDLLLLLSKYDLLWNILQDEEVNRAFPNTFRHSPEVIPDFLKEEVIKGWTEWNEEKWSRLIAKGVFR